MQPKSSSKVRLINKGLDIQFDSPNQESIETIRDYLIKKNLSVPRIESKSLGWGKLSAGDEKVYKLTIKSSVRTEEYVHNLIDEVCQELKGKNIRCERIGEVVDVT